MASASACCLSASLPGTGSLPVVAPLLRPTKPAFARPVLASYPLAPGASRPECIALPLRRRRRRVKKDKIVVGGVKLIQ